MRIPNRTVLLLFGCFLVARAARPAAAANMAGGWCRWRSVLAIGFLLNQFGGIGAGDVKFAAAAAPHDRAGRRPSSLLLLFAAVLLAGLRSPTGCSAPSRPSAPLRPTG